jgi:hypothetical protein
VEPAIPSKADPNAAAKANIKKMTEFRHQRIGQSVLTVQTEDVQTAMREQVDVWTSPKHTDQPPANQCEVCGIVFGSDSLLQKHIQFSSKHKWNVEKQSESLLIAQRADKVWHCIVNLLRSVVI